MKITETERLVLSRLTLDDAEFIFELVNDTAFLRFIGDKGVRDLDGARTYLTTGPLDSYERFGFGLFKVELKDGTPVGTCGLLKRDWLEDPDIGYAFLSGFRRQGYAFEAASATLDYGRSDVGLRRVVAVCSPDNAASIGLLEKLGMSFEGLIKADGVADDECSLYAWDA